MSQGGTNVSMHAQGGSQTSVPPANPLRFSGEDMNQENIFELFQEATVHMTEMKAQMDRLKNELTTAQSDVTAAQADAAAARKEASGSGKKKEEEDPRVVLPSPKAPKMQAPEPFDAKMESVEPFLNSSLLYLNGTPHQFPTRQLHVNWMFSYF